MPIARHDHPWHSGDQPQYERESCGLSQGCKMYRRFAIVATAVLLSSTAARAGDEVIYEPAPQWVAAADLKAAVAKGEPLVLFDRQVRMEDGTVTSYSDVAYKIETPESLTQLGTLKSDWQPDKGDLIVHRLEILRGDEVIDVLAKGAKFTVLRREADLEKRSLDGSLTATLAVPGLRVGDILRVSESTTLHDQALDDAMQFSQGLYADPFKVGFGRTSVSWPSDEKIAFAATRGFDLPDPVERDGYRTVTVNLPIAKLDEVPEDAPDRFKQGTLLQATSFTGWADVSRKMAPHFVTEGLIAKGGPIAQEVAAIEAKAKTPKARMALALQVVQDRIGYLANGMDGGNYLPQAPAQTWEMRYGDCKAKSLLLLSMLREMDIAAQAVLVRSQAGDWVADLLPMPGGFDHMIVRATLDGEDYWLDGTSGGTRLDVIGEVPDFAYALPLTVGGADLVPLQQRWQTVPDRTIRVTYDQSAGIDYAILYDAEIETSGILAARVRPKATETDRKKTLEYIESYVKDAIGDGIVYDGDIAYDEARGIAVIHAKGLLSSPWEFERGRGRRGFETPSSDFTFKPDRARPQWREIPYAVGGPVRYREEVTVVLPDGGKGYELTGRDVTGEMVAGTRITRSATLDGPRLTLTDDAAKLPVEIAASDLAAEKVKAARLNSGDFKLRAPDDAMRYWDRDPAAAQAAVAGLEKAYAQFIAIDPKEAWRYSTRGSLRHYQLDYRGQIADLTKAIELEPTADRYN